MKSKTPGQIAYEQDVANSPNYPDGSPRRTWAQQVDSVKFSWEKNPHPRTHVVSANQV